MRLQQHNSDMGTLTYDSSLAADFDDRTLAHIQFVVGAKLRRDEPFFFTWKDDAAIGDGRSTIWLHPAVPLAFKFVGSRMPTINREWIDLMILAANSPGGLHLMPEPMLTGAPPVSQNGADQ